MKVRLAIRPFPAILAVAASWLLGVQECRAVPMSLMDILGTNDNATVTSGVLTFTFNRETVLSSTFPQASAPTLATVFVTTVPSGITFTFDPNLSVSGSRMQDYNVTIFYTVASTTVFTGAGLSFNGNVPPGNDQSSNPLANSSVNEMVTNDISLRVFKTNDFNSMLTTQNDQTVSLPETFGQNITDTGNIMIPPRGGMGTGFASLTSFTNTFFAPEPPSLAMVSMAGLTVMGIYTWRGRRRSA